MFDAKESKGFHKAISNINFLQKRFSVGYSFFHAAALMESMIFGTIPIATNVGGISQHINHMKNGLLISSEHKASIVERFVENISYLIENEQHLKIISTNANNYALDNFNIDKFNTSYQVLFRKKP